MKLLLFFSFLCLSGLQVAAQDDVYAANIQTPQLYALGNQLGYPIIRLNSADQLELHFDDLDADVKEYDYTIQICNSDWTPAQVSEFDYLKGFSQVRISDYRLSSLALTKYTHYKAIVPDRNCVPIHSGNFLLKVFLNNDTAKLVFTRRFLVVDNSASIAVQFLQPFNPDLSRTHQKMNIKINTHTLNISNPAQQLKVWILQNNRWDNAIHDVQPSFYSGNTFEYNSDEAFTFPGGNEWRWLDLQGDFHYQSDRVQRGVYSKTATDIFVKPDAERARLPYYTYKDYNGMYFIQTTESIDPMWQTDYATVHFSYVTPDRTAYPDKDVYVIGSVTGYAMNDNTKMQFDAQKGMYQLNLFLKQGYYNYACVTVNPRDPNKRPSFEFTEGNHVETENDYTVLLYYRPLGGRMDELVGMTKLNTYAGNR